MVTKAIRRQQILDLLQGNRVHNQEQLKKMLLAEGIRTTQATLSRDLRDLGVSKGPNGYIVPGTQEPTRRGVHELEQTLRMFLLSVERGGHLVVLRTAPGHAQALAVEIDKAQLRGVLGSVAGDDTVFIAAKSSAQASTLVHHLKQLADLP